MNEHEREAWAEAEHFTLAAEGGVLSARAAARVGDPGGETRFGITWRTARSHGWSLARFRALTPALASEFYAEHYWRAPRFDRLASEGREWAGLAVFAFDAGVQHGPARVIGWIQEACGVETQVRRLGPITMQAIRDYGDPTRLALRLLDVRVDFVRDWVEGDPRREALRDGLEARYARLRALLLRLA